MVKDAEEFAKEISKDIASIITEKYSLDAPDLEDVIFNYFKERNENKCRDREVTGI